MTDSYTKKDFEVQWFSGTGPGGQHRNKHQNCCRIVHRATGLRAQGTKHRSRVANQREAFQRLAGMLLAEETAPRRGGSEVVRTYHLVRDDVIDHGSGLHGVPAKVLDGELDAFREAYDDQRERPKSGRVER